MKLAFRIIYVGCLIGLLASCNSTKYVPAGEYLLDKVVIESDNKDYKSSELKSYLRQQPNFKIFGLVKWQLYFYGWSGRNEDRWLNKQIRRMGEAPVILDTLLVDQSAEELTRFFVNKGYADVEVLSAIDTTKRKKAVVTYFIESHEPYRIRNYSMDLDDPKIDSIVHMTAPPRSRFASSTGAEDYIPAIREGDLFDRDLLDKERQRITTLLRRRGYYAFNRDNLGYLADSTVADHQVDVDMLLRSYRKVMPDGSIEERSHEQYYIKDVTFVTDYDPLRLDGDPFIATDTIQSGSVNIIYGINGRTLRPGVLRRSNYMMPGRLFNERALEQTYSSLANMKAIRNINIRFAEIEENDTMKLRATILTTPAKLHGFGVDLEGTNSNGNFGFASSVNYQHRNVFKGSELFSAKVRGTYESLSNVENALNSYWEIGGEASLNFPRFVFPFVNESFRRKVRATTELRVRYNRQSRPEYIRALVSAGWNYIWQNRTNSLARHTFKLLDIDYLYLLQIDENFVSELPEQTRLYNFNNLFIVGAGYSYSFNNYNPQNRQRNTHSFRVSVELAGNALNALSHITGIKKEINEEGYGSYKLFGLDYSQFAKTDFDFSRGIVLDSRNKLAYHIGVGVAVPYGNSNRIPFERRYFSGGANSVRGWSVRSLGPGSMPKDAIKTFAVQVGDIRLDANLEYRTKLFWKFEMAAYIDAGNIWTIRPYDEQPMGNFDFSRFYKEIAFSYGLGLRLDFDFFLIRFDTGFKAYDPQQVTRKEKWAIKHINGDNFAFHFAVGYPF